MPGGQSTTAPPLGRQGSGAPGPTCPSRVVAATPPPWAVVATTRPGPPVPKLDGGSHPPLGGGGNYPPRLRQSLNSLKYLKYFMNYIKLI